MFINVNDEPLLCYLSNDNIVKGATSLLNFTTIERHLSAIAIIPEGVNFIFRMLMHYVFVYKLLLFSQVLFHNLREVIYNFRASKMS